MPVFEERSCIRTIEALLRQSLALIFGRHPPTSYKIAAELQALLAHIEKKAFFLTQFKVTSPQWIQTLAWPNELTPVFFYTAIWHVKCFYFLNCIDMMNGSCMGRLARRKSNFYVDKNANTLLHSDQSLFNTYFNTYFNTHLKSVLRKWFQINFFNLY